MGCLLIFFLKRKEAGKGWTVALSHGPEPTEQTLRESKENTATKSQWSAATGLKKIINKKKLRKKKEEKNPSSCSQNMYDGAEAIFKRVRAAYTQASWQTAADVDSY